MQDSEFGACPCGAEHFVVAGDGVHEFAHSLPFVAVASVVAVVGVVPDESGAVALGAAVGGGVESCPGASEVVWADFDVAGESVEDVAAFVDGFAVECA